jgi:hypothetical protein
MSMKFESSPYCEATIQVGRFECCSAILWCEASHKRSEVPSAVERIELRDQQSYLKFQNPRQFHSPPLEAKQVDHRITMTDQTLSTQNLDLSRSQSHDRVRSSSAGSETAVEGGDQVTHVATTYSSCSGCSKVDWSSNPEEDISKPLHGWPALAKAMEDHPDFEVFPTYRDLNIKSLLYYQAELDDLRSQLHRFEWEDHCRGGFDDAETLSSDVSALLDCGKAKGSRRAMQMSLVEDIRKVLEKYSIVFTPLFPNPMANHKDAALLQYSQINSLPEADAINVGSLRNWLISPAFGNRKISGFGSSTWGDLKQENKSNNITEQFRILVKSVFWPAKPVESHHILVVPRKPKEVDGLTGWVAKEWVPFWQKARETKFWNGVLRIRHLLWMALLWLGHLIWTTLLWIRHLGQKQHPQQQLPYNEKPSRSFTSSVREIFKPAKLHQDAANNVNQDSEEETTIEPTLNTYTMSRMLQFTSLIATLIACLLPIVAITVLSKMHTQPRILGFIALFTALFAMGLMWLTNPGTARTEIFTATAA